MSAAGRSRLILLVEDNDTIRGAFSILLEESGYRVVQARTGEEALSSVSNEPPDLVLMDLGLPDVHGLEVTRRLKADRATREIKIVAVTGRALDTDLDACRVAGCVGVLIKPIDTAQLLERIAGFLA